MSHNAILNASAAPASQGVLEWVGFTPQQWTLSSLLGLVVLMVLFGWLIPRWAVKEIRVDRDAWKTEAIELRETNRLLAQAAQENAEPSKTLAKLLTAAQQSVGVQPDGSVEE